MNDLDITDQGHSTGNFAYISAIFGPVLTKFGHNTIRPATTKNVRSSDVENKGQGHYLKNCCISSII